MRILLLGLMLLCKVYSPNAREAQFAEELKSNGIKLEAGPWDINDEQSLMGMLGYRALWGRYDKDDKCFRMHNKDGNLVYKDDNSFTFNTIAEVRGLAQKLRDGKALSEAYLVLYRDFNRRFVGPVTEPFLYLDPRGFFVSIDQTALLSGSYWTMNKAFYKAAASTNRKKMTEFQKQLEISERKKREEAKITRKELELRLEGERKKTSRVV